jgi:hypothetical protein
MSVYESLLAAVLVLANVLAWTAVAVMVEP